ncbi:hypothetical protein EXIGLDRAFT_844452 [Exidia glandulosa HHB12029]|uniref:MYND-type domain-containing protein n=1 Tax=Exidia glandulosa HHB12029 TaxID=1314781 RepID=A0A165C1H0_EXIGL|nr:hypothetical protein EXIGLDRAFT_844452 [Exidia glandulosa HHB12029]
MQYCSRDCQRRHWKADAFCHKTVCAQLKALLPLLDKGEEEFVSAARALLSIEQLAVVYDNVSLGNGDRTLSTAERLRQTEAMLRVQERMAQMSVHDPTDTLHTLRALGFRP